MLILVFASVLSFALGEWEEAVAIAAILVLNALIGFFQEYRAENAVLALQNMTAPRASVMREGRQVLVPARDIVPEDLLLLEAGDIVAADARIRRASRLQLNEAILTGESMPVGKEFDPNSDAFVLMGTAVVTGTALAQVSAIGMSTELGKIAHLITTAESSPTPLQVQLSKLGHMLLWICLCVVGLVWTVGAWSNLWLLGVVIVTGTLQLSLHFVPLTQDVFGLKPLVMRDLALIVPLSLITITVVEVRKLLFR